MFKKDKNVYMRMSAHFGETAQNCDYVSNMIIEWYRNTITTTIWSSANPTPRIKIKKYWWLKSAYNKYQEYIGKALLGGWPLKELKSGEKTIFKYEYKNGTKGNYKDNE